MKNTIIIAGFPGIGKSYCTKTMKDILISDSDSSKYSWIQEGRTSSSKTDFASVKRRNPNFVQDYLEQIDSLVGEKDLIFTSTHADVLKALLDKYPDRTFVVYPNRDRKDEFLALYKQRGSSEEFVANLDKNWNSFINDIENASAVYTHRYRLDGPAMLKDALSSVVRTYAMEAKDMAIYTLVESSDTKYTKYIEDHKKAVTSACCIYGERMAKSGILNFDLDDLKYHVSLHDESKYSKEEFIPYRDFFYGSKEVKADPTTKEAFEAAWLHHIVFNKHHWNHWVICDGDGVRPIDMPDIFIAEMLCDWIAMDKGVISAVIDWYQKQKMVLSPNTADKVVRMLKLLKEDML